MRAASLMSTSGAAFTGAVCASTTARSVSTVSFASQQGQVTSIVGAGFFAISAILRPKRPRDASTRAATEDSKVFSTEDTEDAEHEEEKDLFFSGRAPQHLSLDFHRERRENFDMALELTTSCLKDSVSLFRYYKRLGDGAIAQASDEAIFATLDPEANSIAIIVKHLSGNMRSRWTDFLTSDGEKPDRDRDSEFEAPPKTRAELLALWESAWEIVFRELGQVKETDLVGTIYIRGEAHSVMQAIHRQLAHYSYHVGQIVFLAKHFAGSEWQSLSIPRGKSSSFNSRVASGKASQR
jgi:hypothetical protein